MTPTDQILDSYLARVKSRGLDIPQATINLCKDQMLRQIIPGSAGHIKSLLVDRLRRNLFSCLKHGYPAEYLDKMLAK